MVSEPHLSSEERLDESMGAGGGGGGGNMSTRCNDAEQCSSRGDTLVQSEYPPAQSYISESALTRSYDGVLYTVKQQHVQKTMYLTLKAKNVVWENAAEHTWWYMTQSLVTDTRTSGSPG